MLLRGAIVNRTYSTHKKKLFFLLFLLLRGTIVNRTYLVYKKRKKATAVRSSIPSNLMLASSVWYFDRGHTTGFAWPHPNYTLQSVYKVPQNFCAPILLSTRERCTTNCEGPVSSLIRDLGTYIRDLQSRTHYILILLRGTIVNRTKYC